MNGFDIEGKEREIERDAQALAWVLGMEREAIAVRRPDWLRFMKNSVLVTVHVRRWRAIMSLTPKHLGLAFETDEEKEAFEKSLRLGDLLLLPRRYMSRLATLESQLRKLPWKHGYKTFWGWMLTPAGYSEWKKAHADLEAEYQSIAREIFDNYNDITFEVADMHSANARAAYRREMEHVQRGGKSNLVNEFTEEGFVRNYVNLVLDEIPSADDIRSSFGVEVDFEYIPLPAVMAEEQAAVEIAYEKVERERAKTEIELEMQRDVAETTKRKTNDIVVAHMKNIVTQLNQVLLDAATDITRTVTANQKVHPRSVVQLKNAVSKVRAMVDAMSGYVQYDDIRLMLEKAESLVDAPAQGKRDSARTLEALQNIATVTKQTILTLGETPRSGRTGEEYEVPTAGEVRQARASLGMAEKELPQAPAQRRRRRAAA